MTDLLPLLPYRVKNSGRTLDSVLNKSIADCVMAARNFNLNPVSYYTDALDKLIRICNCDIRTMDRFMADFSGKDEVILGIRHDVDHDIDTARKMSLIEKQYGISASYYILHSHPFIGPGYYAEFEKETSTLLRNEALAEVYLEMQENGSEIGMHVDAIRFYGRNIDGMQAIVSEIKWLRTNGLNIHGIAGHNSAPADGCENFEFFSEYHLNHFPYVYGIKRKIKLGQLSAAALGLSYEANYAASPCFSGNPGENFNSICAWLKYARNADRDLFLQLYLQQNKYCQWGSDIICWLYGRDCWAVSQNDGPYFRNASLDEVLDITANAKGKRVLWHIHPFYLGQRNAS